MEDKPSILVIDDEQGLRDMLLFTLGNEGYTVFCGKNGEEGLKMLATERIDLVITDIKMPGMDGITVLGKIKEINPGIEVIMVTGNGTMETAIESLRKGAFDFINKPVNLNELLAVLKKAYEIKRIKSDLVSMKKLDKLKDDFFSMVTHELRTPLTAIGGSVKLLTSDIEIPEVQKKEILQIMHRNVNKLRSLVDTILDFSKMEAGFWVLKKTNAVITGIIGDSIDQIMPMAESENISISKYTSLSGRQYPAEDTVVNCDQVQIERVILNLISNSIKYTQTGGKIAVWSERTGDEIWIVVEDNGKGIPHGNIGKVFDKFYRIDNSDTKKEYGLGLGLSICRKIIDLHGGNIWAESEGPGHGSRFIFSLPINGGAI